MVKKCSLNLKSCFSGWNWQKWHKISLLAYTEVSNHCKCIFNGCKIVSYHRGFGSMSKVTITKKIGWKNSKKPQKLVCDIYAYTSIFWPWLSIIERKCQKTPYFSNITQSIGCMWRVWTVLHHPDYYFQTR